MGKVRWTMAGSQEVPAVLDGLAGEEATTKPEIGRRAFSGMKAFRQRKGMGRVHIAAWKDRNDPRAWSNGLISGISGAAIRFVLNGRRTGSGGPFGSGPTLTWPLICGRHARLAEW